MKILKKIIELISSKIIAGVRILLRIDQKITLGEIDLVVPPDHGLPNVLRSFPQYDRFLPQLSEYLTKGSVVVDVGANIGDTLIAMWVKNKDLSFICVEPDPYFYDYLLKNIKTKEHLLDINTSSQPIKTYKNLIGIEVINADLKRRNGTAHAQPIESNGALNRKTKTTVSLDDLLSDTTNISLIKTDTDGFDYDVINSGLKTIDREKPLLFFECEYSTESQKKGMKNMISTLETKGYSFAIFDNFGALVQRRSNKETLFEWMEYVWLQNIKKSHRTIFYYDILAYIDKQAEFVNNVLKNY